MARPKIDEKAKRVAVSISVPQAIKEAAEASGNASRYFEGAVRACAGIKALLDELGRTPKRATVEDTLDEIDDLITVWSRLGEEAVPFVAAAPSPAPSRPKRPRKPTSKRTRKAS